MPRALTRLAAAALPLVAILAAAQPAHADRGCLSGKACTYQHASYEGGRGVTSVGANNRDYPGTRATLDNGVTAHNTISSVRNLSSHAITWCHHGGCGGIQGPDLYTMPAYWARATWGCQSTGGEGDTCWNDQIDGHFWH